VRKIKVSNKRETVEKVTGRAVPSKTGRIQLALDSAIAERKLTKNEVEILTDYGAVIDALVKELTADVKVIKAGLMAYAIKTKTKKFAGVKGTYSIGSTSSTEEGTPTEFVKLLKKLKKTNLFDDLVKVKIGEAKKYLGEQVLKDNGFIKKTTNAFGKIALKVIG
jgi:hypothetical protein